MTDKGAELNRRVWELFERAGFKTKPNSNDPAEEVVTIARNKSRTLDLCATDKNLGVKIIGWNKSVTRLRESFTVHLHDFNELRKQAKANSALFVSTEKEISADDRKYCEELGMRVWHEDELRYYEALVDAIGEYAKYEIIHSFGVTTKEEKQIYQVLAVRLQQPMAGAKTNLFMFTIPAEKLLRTGIVYRRAQGNAEAYQRMIKKKRLDSIRAFVSGNDALLPPNVIVHFSDSVRWDQLPMPKLDTQDKAIRLTRNDCYDLVLLRIPMEYASLELIDGQHRVYGFVKCDPATRESFNLVVLGMTDLDPGQRRDTFVAINSNSRRMDPNLVSFLKYSENDTECQSCPEVMAIRVVVDLSRDSPFKGRIRLLDFSQRALTLKGLSGYDLRSLVGTSGLLRKYYGNTPFEYVKALKLYFGHVYSIFKKEWHDPKVYIVCTNRGISAFLKLLKSMLKTEKARLTDQAVLKYLKALRKHMAQRDWRIRDFRNRYTAKYVGSGGWSAFHRAMVEAVKREFPNFKQ